MSRDFFIGFSNQNVTPSKVVVFFNAFGRPDRFANYISKKKMDSRVDPYDRYTWSYNSTYRGYYPNYPCISPFKETPELHV